MYNGSMVLISNYFDIFGLIIDNFDNFKYLVFFDDFCLEKTMIFSF